MVPDLVNESENEIVVNNQPCTHAALTLVLNKLLYIIYVA
jgi:hypothetical protein